MEYFTRLSNADVTATRSQGERTAAGYEENSVTDVLQARADVQLSGRELERKQKQLHVEADALLFVEKDVSDLQPGDDLTIGRDGGQTLGGTVREVSPLDDAVLVGLEQ